MLITKSTNLKHLISKLLLKFARPKSINKAVLLGHLAFDPEIRHAKDNSEFAILLIITNQIHNNKDGRLTFGEYNGLVACHEVLVFNQDFIRQIKKSFKKDDLVYVEGSITNSNYQDQILQVNHNARIELRSSDHILRNCPQRKPQSSQCDNPISNPCKI
jgi:single-stranded DNA-binding protein